MSAAPRGTPAAAVPSRLERHAAPDPTRRDLVAAALGLAACGLPARAAPGALPVVTTTADLRSLVEIVGGDHVDVVSLVPPGSSSEDYAARPRDIDRLRAARLVVRIGLDYDLWLDRLLRQAGNPALLRNGPGYVDASRSIALLEVKGEGGLAGGAHAHGQGNPHYWLDPANAEIVTGHVFEALVRLDERNARHYEQRRLQFLARLEERTRAWQAQLAPLAGRALLAYHNNWPYLARRFRLKFVGTIETREGVAPSPAALAALMRRMRDEQVAVIVRHPTEPRRDVDFLAAKTGARVAVLAASVGDLPQVRDYFELFETNVAALVAAVSAGGR